MLRAVRRARETFRTSGRRVPAPLANLKIKAGPVKWTDHRQATISTPSHVHPSLHASELSSTRRHICRLSKLNVDVCCLDARTVSGYT
jgi:hypothetical protein